MKSSFDEKVLEEAKPYIRPWVPIINLAKGLEITTKMHNRKIPMI